MTDPVRAGVIGYGLGGRVFHAAFIHAVPGLALTAIVQRTGDEAARAYPEAKIYRSADALFADPAVQLIAITTPNETHAPLARQALNAGKHVVIDKPFALSSAEAAALIRLARDKNLVLSAFQNRRWDGDFLTVRKLIDGGALGRLVSFESHFDRFRPEPRLATWKESGAPGGGLLLDLGTHLIDQALALFGVPENVTASIRIDRDHGLTDDAFDVRLAYRTFHGHTLNVWLRSTLTAAIGGPRFTLHGTRGSYVKWGLDPQENAVQQGEAIGTPNWGEELESAWGTLRIAVQTSAENHNDGHESRVRTEAGDYRAYYANVRDAILGRAELAVPGIDAWRTSRIIEIAHQSSDQGRTLSADLGPEP